MKWWPLLLVGCGPGSYSEFRDQFAQHLCEQARHCGEIGAGDPCPYPSPLPPFDGVDVPTAIADGRLGYDSHAAQACLDAFDGAPCDPAILAIRVYEHCHDVVGPHVAAGGACHASAECVGGFCDGSFACAGHCVAWPPPHAPCMPGDCDPTVEFCAAAGTCELQMGEGGPCSADGECQYPFICDGGKCRHHPRAGDGQTCDSASVCDDGRYCSPSTNVCTGLHGAGAACDARDGCVRDYGCGASGMCRSWSDDGRACDDAPCPLSQSCGAGGDGGMTCQSDPTLPAGPRESCDTRACAGGLYCSGSRRCEYLHGFAAACDTGDPGCAPGLTCSDGRCQPSPSPCATP